MIHFNELYITEDEKNLVIDTEIDSDGVYQDCYISKIIVDIADNCESPGLFRNPLVIWNATPKSIGDLDGDGRFTSADVGLYRGLLGMTNIWDIGSGHSDKYIIHVEEDGSMSYIGQKYDPETGEYILNEQTGDYEVGNVPISETLYSLYKQAVYNYDDPIQGIDHNTPYLGNKIIPFITEQFTDLSIYSTILGTENTSGIIGDFNNDGEVNIADINALIEGLSNYAKNIENGTVEEILYDQKQHVRICPDKIDLMPLIGKDGHVADHIYVVRVEAVMVDKDGSIAKMGCGWDKNVIEGFAYNDKLLYDKALSLASNYGNDCNNNDASAFMDFILRYYAFIFALKCGDTSQACYYWNNYLKDVNMKSGFTGGGCGCHGTRW